MLREIYRLQQGLFLFLLYMFLISTGYSLERSAQVQHKIDGVSVSVSLEYDQGDYGTADTTNNWRVPLSLNYSQGDFFSSIDVSYISAQSTGTIIVISGSNKRPKTATSTTTSKVSGLGDVNLSAGYYLNSSSKSNTKYYVSADIKLATADENAGLGTGATDYAIEAGLNTEIDQLGFFASIGYQITGDSDTINYNNIFYTNIGMLFDSKKQIQPGIMLDYSQAANQGIKDSFELTGFFNYSLENKRSLYFYIVAGLSESSPDYGAGVNYRIGY